MAGSPSYNLALLPATTLAAAGTYTSTTPIIVGSAFAYLCVQTKFVRAAGGTSCKVYIQTSLDGGTTWVDIVCHTFLTTTATKISRTLAVDSLTASTAPTDGTLADDTVLGGVLGDRFRVKYVVVGTYSGASSLTVTAEAK